VAPRRLLARVSRGDLTNVRFADACRLVEELGFELRRRRGSHHVFMHPRVDTLLNLQEVAGEAKPYQLRQLLRLIERYRLTLEDDA
jgi:predicted RNA binding protein YcfA (HicA-like mRNA interferase family)